MEISTSILNASDRIDSVLKLNRTNTSYIHVDVMDGKFVDNVEFNINEINAVNRVAKYPMDIHLMVNDPISYIVKLKNMNISYITFHLEIRKKKEKIISKIKELGYKVGISIKPNTDIKKLEPYLKDIDMVLVMSVEPGQGGQKFLDNTVNRVNELKKIIDDGGYDIKIEVDGGINNETILKLQNVDIAVVGSYIVNSDNYYNKIEKLINNVNNVKLIDKEGISNLLTGIGLFLIFVAAIMDLGSINFNIIKSIYSNFWIFLMGYFSLSIGMFIKPLNVNNIDNDKKVKLLNKKKNLYKILLGIGFLLLIILIVNCFFNGLVDLSVESFIIGIYFLMLLYCPIMLLAVLFIVVSIVKLSEIKRLSQK